MMNKKSGFFAFLTKKQARYGWYSVLLTALFIAVVIVVNIIAGAIETKWALKIDASSNKLTSFSDQTYSVLDGLDQEIHIYLLFQNQTQSDLRVQLEEITNKFRARNDRIKIDLIDPITEPARVKKYLPNSDTTLSEGSIIVTNADETRVKTIRASELYSYGQNQQTGQYYITSFNGESKLTPALMYVSSMDTPKVYFLQGHDEYPLANCSILQTYLQNENFDVSELTLGTGTELKAGDTLIIGVARKDLTNDEYAEIKAWLESGGRLFYANEFNVDVSKLPNLNNLLKYYSLGFENGMVIEDQNETSRWIQSPMLLIPMLDAENDITSKMANSGRMLLQGSGAVSEPDMPLSGYGYKKLLTSSSSSYMKNVTSETSVLTREDGDTSGPFTLAMSVIHQPDVKDPTKDTRIVLINNPLTLLDTDYMTASSNLDFSMNAISWLVNREVSVYIRSKAIANATLALPDAGTFWTLTTVVVVIIPAIVLLAGVVVWIRRRRL